MGKISIKSVRHDGTPLNFRVTDEVGGALVAESKRLQRTVAHVASEIMHTWYHLDYLPSLKEKTK